MFKHLPIEMAGNAHDGLVAHFRLGEYRNEGMAQVMKPEAA